MWKQLFVLAMIFGVSVADAQDGSWSGVVENRAVSVDATWANQHNVKYPPLATALNAQGRAVLLVLVGSDGNPKYIKVEQSSGYRFLDAAAINAVKDWKFSPGIKNGQRTDAYARLPVEFSTSNNRTPLLTPQGKLVAEVDRHIRQDGLIEDAKSSFPMPFNTAGQGLDVLAKSSTNYQVEYRNPSEGVVIYEADSAVDLSQVFVAFTKGSPFYPSVVRMRFVPGPNFLEVHRAILCGAGISACASLRKMLDEMDRKCGAAVPGCPRPGN